jgi:hypothetical protein
MSEAKGSQKFQVNALQILITIKIMSAYGGFSLLAKFFEKLHLREFLINRFPVVEVSPNALGPYPKLLAFMLMLFAGGKRFSHWLYLGDSNEIFAGLFGVERLPKAASTLTRFFSKMKSWGKTHWLSEKLWAFLSACIPWAKIQEDDLTFDSHVCVRYGKQEGSKRGYNPKKRGRPCHHPILAFLNKSRYIVNLWNRSGNSSAANNSVAFLEQTVERLKACGLKIRTVFADSGFYDLKFIQALEHLAVPYILAVPLYQILQGRFFDQKLLWHEVAPGIEMSEFRFKHKKKNWDKERRYFVIREKLRPDKDIVGKQLSLFPDHELTKDYRYRAYMTDSPEDMKALWDRYRPRADDENRIKEMTEDFGFNGFSLHSFYGTEAAMLTLCFMYNLFNLFRHELLSEDEAKQRASTIRYAYWAIPAIVGTQGRQAVLRLGIASKTIRAKMEYLFSRISTVFSANQVQLQCS